MRRLDVWLERFEAPIGTLRADDAGVTDFAYEPAFAARPDAHPLSLSLPLREESYGDLATRTYFQNLLPENDQLAEILEREGLDRSDVAGILAHVGEDLAGAVSCLPEGSPPVKRPGDLATDYDVLDEDALDDVVARLGENAPLPGELHDPSPVAGYQRKIAVTILEDGRYALPRPGIGVPTTHILKVPDTSLPREAFYEGVCAALASHVGLHAAEAATRWHGQYEAILSRRFDRTITGGRVERVHQEDFAQALGLPSRLKYERDASGGRRFDAAAIAALLARTASPAAATDAFLRATFFNLAVGNSDNHAKNHALLYHGGPVPEPAPLYDIVPIALSKNHTHRLAFDIGRATLFEEVGPGEVFTLLATFGVSGSAAVRFLERAVRPMLRELNEYDGSAGPWADRLGRLIVERAGRLGRVLDEAGARP